MFYDIWSYFISIFKLLNADVYFAFLISVCIGICINGIRSSMS